MLLIHPLKHLQGLEAVAHRVPPKPVGLIGPQIALGLGLKEPRHPSSQGPSDHQQAGQPA
jgi:hypothetical protein